MERERGRRGAGREGHAEGRGPGWESAPRGSCSEAAAPQRKPAPPREEGLPAAGPAPTPEPPPRLPLSGFGGDRGSAPRPLFPPRVGELRPELGAHGPLLRDRPGHRSGSSLSSAAHWLRAPDRPHSPSPPAGCGLTRPDARPCPGPETHLSGPGTPEPAGPPAGLPSPHPTATWGSGCGREMVSLRALAPNW